MTTNPINGNFHNISPNTSSTDTVKGKANNSENSVASAGQQQAQEGKNVPSDKVSLTPSVQKLREVEQSLADVPEVDDARVAKIKQQIENNEYSINADNVADKLIQMEKLIK